MTVNYQIKFATKEEKALYQSIESQAKRRKTSVKNIVVEALESKQKEDQKKALPLTNWVNGELDKIKGYDKGAFQDIVDPLLIVAFAILRDRVEMPLEDAANYAASVMKWTYMRAKQLEAAA
jgi:hypothetical protein